LLIICFWRCKETVVISAKQNKEAIPLKKGLKGLVKNQYFWAVLILWMLQSVSFGISGTILPYYCKYIFHNDTWMYSFLYLTETLILVACIFSCTPFIRKFGKRNVAFAGAVIALAGQLLFFLNPQSFSWMVMSCVARAIGLAPLNAVVFGMIGDVVEFGQWKNHMRQESLVFAGGSIGTKVGAGVASAAMTGLLSVAGYISSSTGAVVQPQEVLNMIVSIYKFGPIIVAALAVITLFFYKLDKQYPAIMTELMQRESQGEL
ncbi:MAG: MFS transporter, partial [Clostridium sp.]